MKVSSKKEKGRVGERTFAKMLVNAGLDKYAKRSPLSGAVKGFDSDIITKLPFSFEVKNQETWKPLKYYQQAQTANPNRGRLTTTVIMTRNNEDYYAFLKVDDFLTLIAYAMHAGFPDGDLTKPQ